MQPKGFNDIACFFVIPSLNECDLYAAAVTYYSMKRCCDLCFVGVKESQGKEFMKYIHEFDRSYNNYLKTICASDEGDDSRCIYVTVRDDVAYIDDLVQQIRGDKGSMTDVLKFEFLVWIKECKKFYGESYNYLTPRDATRLYIEAMTHRAHNVFTLKNKEFDMYRLSSMSSRQDNVHVVEWIYVEDVDVTAKKDFEYYLKNAQSLAKVDKAHAISLYKFLLASFELNNSERYIALLNIGKTHTNIDERRKHLKEGILLFPKRLECLHELILLEQSQGDHRAATTFGLLAFVNDPDGKHAYDPSWYKIDTDVYEWRFDFDFAVSSYYAKEYEKGYAANLRAKVKAPPHVLKLIEQNVCFFPQHKQPLSTNINQEKEKHEVKTVSSSIVSSISTFSYIAIDNFYSQSEMDEAVSVAGKTKYVDYGHYAEAPAVSHLFKQKIEKLVGRSLSVVEIAYKYTTKLQPNFIHADKSQYVACVYLQPDAPLEAGLTFYRHKATKKESLEDGDVYKMKEWECTEQISNKYNRCVIYKGSVPHTLGSKTFGEDWQSGRLVQVAYFSM